MSEIWRLIDATRPTSRPAVTVLCWNGMRVSEALGLRWRDIGLVEGVFRVSGQLAALKRGETPCAVPTKSRRGVREMPFLPVVRQTLEAHLATELVAGRGPTDDFVFVTRTERPFTRQNVSERGIEKAGVRGGLGEGDSRPGAPTQLLHVHGGV